MNEAGNAHPVDSSTEIKLKGFKAHEIDSKSPPGHRYNRKDFYKISLNKGRFIFHYADRSYETEGSILFFGNPRIPYSCEVFSQTGDYACLFTEDFLNLSERSASLLHSPLFKLGGTPILQVNREQKDEVAAIFQKMVAEQESNYTFKNELIGNYIHLLIHETLKMQPSENGLSASSVQATS